MGANAVEVRALAGMEAVVRYNRQSWEDAKKDIDSAADMLHMAVKALWEDGEIEDQNVHTLSVDLHVYAEVVAKRVACLLKKDLEKKINEEGLCPECYAELEEGGFVKELMGECWGSPAYQEVATKMECPKCGYEEEL